MKHTPGPWTIRVPHFDEPRRGNLRIVAKLLEDGTQDPIAEVSAVKDTFAESASNARLIAAAPDLLAAAKEIVSRTPMFGSGENYDALRAAIARAEGK